MRYSLSMRLWCFGVVVVLGLTACGDSGSKSASGGGPPGGRPPAAVVIDAVIKTRVADEIEAIGTLEAKESVLVTATVTDTVASVHFEDGHRVEKGDILVTLTKDEQSAELEEALANLDESERQLARLESIGGNLASKSEIDLARAQVGVNKGRLEAIKARLDDRIVSAPFAGVLGVRKVSVGAVVSPGSEIARLDDISELNLDFSVPEFYLGRLILGSAVTGESIAMPGEQFQGKVTFIESRIDPATRSVLVRAKLPNADFRLFPGMLMSVTLFAQEREALVVAEGALQQVGKRSSVYVVDEDFVVAKRAVEIGKRVPGGVVVTEGLQAGESIVVDGTLKLRDGAKVRAVAPVSDAQLGEKKEPVSDDVRS